MQTQSLAQTVAQRDFRDLLMVNETPVPAVLDRTKIHAHDLEGVRVALSEAEKVIVAQQERIRQLEDMAMTDELTDLVNRRGFMMALQRELAMSRRDADAEGVLVMIDLDGFKTINDVWGHAAGDEYLRAVARSLVADVRSTDIVARLGGDEFVVLLTHIDRAAGMARATDMEKTFNSRVMQWRHRTLPLRGSFGVSAYRGTYTASDVMKEADLRLYQDKAVRRARGN